VSRVRTDRSIKSYVLSELISQIKLNITRFAYSVKYMPTVGFLGILNKPDTNEIRESLTVNIAKELLRQGYKVMIGDIEGVSEVDGIKVCSLDDILSKCDIFFVFSSHKKYKELLGEDSSKIFYIGGG